MLTNLFKIMHFSNVEYANIHPLDGESGGNASAAVRFYCALFPNRRQTFVEVVQRLQETGLLQPSMCGRSNRVLNVEEQILNATEENPGKYHTIIGQAI
jgi:hypothetical protein